MSKMYNHKDHLQESVYFHHDKKKKNEIIL